MNEWMNEWNNKEWIIEWMNSWMSEWMNEKTIDHKKIEWFLKLVHNLFINI